MHLSTDIRSFAPVRKRAHSSKLSLTSTTLQHEKRQKIDIVSSSIPLSSSSKRPSATSSRRTKQTTLNFSAVSAPVVLSPIPSPPAPSLPSVAPLRATPTSHTSSVSSSRRKLQLLEASISIATDAIETGTGVSGSYAPSESTSFLLPSGKRVIANTGMKDTHNDGRRASESFRRSSTGTHHSQLLGVTAGNKVFSNRRLFFGNDEEDPISPSTHQKEVNVEDAILIPGHDPLPVRRKLTLLPHRSSVEHLLPTSYLVLADQFSALETVLLHFRHRNITPVVDKILEPMQQSCRHKTSLTTLLQLRALIPEWMTVTAIETGYNGKTTSFVVGIREKVDWNDMHLSDPNNIIRVTDDEKLTSLALLYRRLLCITAASHNAFLQKHNLVDDVSDDKDPALRTSWHPCFNKNIHRHEIKSISVPCLFDATNNIDTRDLQSVGGILTNLKLAANQATSSIVKNAIMFVMEEKQKKTNECIEKGSDQNKTGHWSAASPLLLQRAKTVDLLRTVEDVLKTKQMDSEIIRRQRLPFIVSTLSMAFNNVGKTSLPLNALTDILVRSPRLVITTDEALDSLVLLSNVSHGWLTISTGSKHFGNGASYVKITSNSQNVVNPIISQLQKEANEWTLKSQADAKMAIQNL